MADPEDLAAVNGASMLWSAVREQVLTITSRMRAGPVVLPSVHFHDLKKQTEASKVSVAPKTGAKGVRRSKSD